LIYILANGYKGLKVAGGGTIDFDLKGNELKEAIYVNSVMTKTCKYNKSKAK